MEKISAYKLSFVTCVAAMTALWGWFGWIVVALVFLMAVDYIGGSAIAVKDHAWSSSAARAGIWHKCGCVLAIVVAGMADLIIGQILGNLPVELPFSYSVLFCPMVVVWYILTEMGSILEHVVKMGAPVPAFLKRALEMTLDAMDETGNRMTEGGDIDE